MTRCGFRLSRGAVLVLAGALLAGAWAGCASAPPAGAVSSSSPSARAAGQAPSAPDATAADNPESPAPSARAAGTVPPPDAGRSATADPPEGTPAPPGVAPPATGTGSIPGFLAGAPAADKGSEGTGSGTTAANPVPPAGTAALGAPSPGAARGASSGGLVLRLSASPAVLQVGEQVTVEVRATASGRVVDAPLHLAYDATRLRYVAGEEGDFLKRDGSGTVFLINGRSQAGVITIGLGRLDRQHGLSGAGTHCRVRFEVIAPGRSRVAVGQAMAWADDGAMLPVGTDAITISVPEP